MLLLEVLIAFIRLLMLLLVEVIVVVVLEFIVRVRV